MTKPAVLLLLTLVACRAGEKPPPTSPPPPAPTAPSAPPAPKGPACDTAGGSCNTVKLAGAPVTPARVAGTAPTPAGGDLPSGTYALAETRQYTGPGGPAGSMDHSEQMTIVITREGKTARVEGVEGQPGCPDKHETLSLTFDGVNSTAQRTCPPCPPEGGRDCHDTRPYTWDGKALTEFIEQDGKTWTRTFVPVAH